MTGRAGILHRSESRASIFRAPSITVGLQHKGCNFQRSDEPISPSVFHCRSRLQPRQTHGLALYSLRLSAKFDRHPERRTVQTRDAHRRAAAAFVTEAGVQAHHFFTPRRPVRVPPAALACPIHLQAHAFDDAMLFDSLGFEASAVEVERVAILRHHAHHILRRSFGKTSLHLERHLDPCAILRREMGDDGRGF